MAVGSSSLPEGEAMCLKCRRAGLTVHKRTLHRKVCPSCGGEFDHPRKAAKFCSRLCSSRAAVSASGAAYRPESHPHVKRAKLERQAPGLSTRKRSALLADWRRRGAPCAYCGRPADTVDHVVPLVLGGTNFEGNLAPCCRKCNSSKAGLTVFEWRHDRHAHA